MPRGKRKKSTAEAPGSTAASPFGACDDHLDDPAEVATRARVRKSQLSNFSESS